MANTKKIKGAGNKPKPKPRTNTYYHWDKNVNDGWLPKGSDNPITRYAKGFLKVTTGLDVPNRNKVYHDLKDKGLLESQYEAPKRPKGYADYKDYKRTIAGRGDTHALDVSINTSGKYGVDY